MVYDSSILIGEEWVQQEEEEIGLLEALHDPVATDQCYSFKKKLVFFEFLLETSVSSSFSSLSVIKPTPSTFVPPY